MILVVLCVFVSLGASAARGPSPARLANDETYCKRYGGSYRRMRCPYCNECELNGNVYSQKDFVNDEVPSAPRAPRRPAVPPRISIDAYKMANSREYCEGNGGQYAVARCPFCNECRGPNGNVYTQKQYPPQQAQQLPPRQGADAQRMADSREYCEANGGQYFVARCMYCNRCVGPSGNVYNQQDFH